MLKKMKLEDIRLTAWCRDSTNPKNYIIIFDQNLMKIIKPRFRKEFGQQRIGFQKLSKPLLVYLLILV